MTKDGNTNRETVAEREEGVLSFWKENNIFKKSEQGIHKGFFSRLRYLFARKKTFIFYDGPPFATGLPHYGHILVSAVKDAMARYKTMRGYRVPRRWGWDCHGLPLEVEMEKEIGTKSKKEIQEYGIERFNKQIKKVIFKYADEWKKVIPRIGRWVDMENDYRTMNTAYMESVWSVFHRLYRRGFVSNGFKTLFLCPRCSTVISNNEVADSYEMLTDTAVHVLFPLKDKSDITLVAWTTTPWTLFGNVALGVDPNLEYTIAEKEGKKYALHENALHLIEGATVVEKKKGSEFIGKEYAPPFDHLYTQDKEEVRAKIWRVQAVSYVDPTVGTGIVHLAPAYGDDDMKTAKKLKLPIQHHVTEDGVFVPQLNEFAGLRPKEAGNPNTADEKIIEALEKKGLLLKSESIEHNYPVCWRCTTPLLNYATSSWLVHAERYKDTMVAENKKVHWVPNHIRDGRFGNWLASAREWAVSRSRFWGTPLPIWQVEKTGEYMVIDSLQKMFENMREKNRYTFLRHAHSVSNEKRIFSCLKEGNEGLTARGRMEAQAAAKKIKQQTPTVIFCSPLKRTKETAECLAKEAKVQVIEEPLLAEIQIPEMHGKSIGALARASEESGAYKNPEAKIAGGESHGDVYRRMLEFFEKVDKEYSDANIIVVTHHAVIRNAKALSPTNDVYKKAFLTNTAPIRNASQHQVSYKYVQRTEEGEVDIHRPYIDTVVLYDKDGNQAFHCKEVFDCWFESGAMPYGSFHYPFEKTSGFNPKRNKKFPADFICEALDQTRGWFYSLIAIGVGAFGKAPYKQVTVTGIVRAEDGKKMSKSLKNYTDPMQVVERYGADALRHYLLASPLVRGENLDFKDEQVEEMYKKVYGRLHNCLNFYATYAHLPHRQGGRNLLDIYIKSRLAEVHQALTKGFERYRIDEAAAPLAAFVDDLSTWYIRRSRDRMRYDTVDGAHARETLRFVLTEFAKCMAPIAPFYAEYLFREMRKYRKHSSLLPESVHLCPWRKKMKIHHGAIAEIERVREIVSIAHEQRVAKGIKVRQPLPKITVQSLITEAGRQLIAEEVNVKEVLVQPEAKEAVVLDTTLTPELKAEGFVRECVRNIQKIRKEKGFSLTETLHAMHIHLPKEQQKQLKTFEEKIKKEVRVNEIIFEEEARENAEKCTVQGTEISLLLIEQPGKIFQ